MKSDKVCLLNSRFIKKKSLYLVLPLFFILLFSFSFINAFAGGNGTELNPYQISNATELQNMNANLAASYILINDINGLELNDLTPIGSATTKFTGNFDGQGYKIFDIYINKGGADNIGIFGFISYATISNVGLIDIQIPQTSGDNIGALVGNAEFSTISNSYSTGYVQGSWQIGGLVGNNGEGNAISDCYSTVTVNGAGNYLGGLVGYNVISETQLNATVSNSYSTGTISAMGVRGGLIGGAGDAFPFELFITNSFWDMTTSGRPTSSGGTGKTTSEMYDINTFLNASWDIALIENYTDEIWEINNTFDYPHLVWFEPEEPECYVDIDCEEDYVCLDGFCVYEEPEEPFSASNMIMKVGTTILTILILFYVVKEIRGRFKK